MKNKFFLVILIGVILGFGMVLVSCDALLEALLADIGCPGDGNSGGKDNCKFVPGTGGSYGSIKECSDRCIYDQGIDNGTTLSYPYGASCNC